MKGLTDIPNPNKMTYTIEETPFFITSIETQGYLVSWSIESVLEGTVGNIEIEGTLTPIEYQITYDLNGGVSNGGNPDTYNIETAGILKEATHSTLYFDYWTLNDQIIQTLEGVMGNITLKANWTDVKKLHITEPISSLSIDDLKIELIFELPISNSIKLNFGPNTTHIEINGNGYMYTMNVVIMSSLNVDLHLYNIGIKAPDHPTNFGDSKNYAIYKSQGGVKFIYISNSNYLWCDGRI